MTKLNADLAFLILAIVAEIPSGAVATYGQVATLAGYPKNARLVGKVLRHAQTYGHYPCHRVVNAQGRCVPHWPEQVTLLQAEKIPFRRNGTVDLKKCQWKV